MKLKSQFHALPAHFTDAFRYGVMISNAWPNSRATSGATLDAIQRVLARFPFVEAVQTVDIPFPDERRAVFELVRGSGRPHTYMLTRVLNENHLNLSSPDKTARARACEKITDHLDDALEAGANVVGVVSGPRPPDNHAMARADALRGLEESLATLCAAAKPLGLKIEIEPLDFDAHKRGTLGTTTEAVAMCRNLAAHGLDLRLCIDQAHALLNGEDVCEAAALARPHMEDFHICNAVLDRAHPLFGDRHLPPGAPGVVDGEKIAALFQNFAGTGIIDTTRKNAGPIISCEVLTPDGADPLALMENYTTAMQRSWEKACASLKFV